MNRVYPAYYKDFCCIADRCEDTCCAGWEIDIDDATYEAYCKVGGEIGVRLRNSIRAYDTEEVYEAHGFILTDDMRCPFLDEHNLCDIYKELGEKALCEVCTNTPRNYLEYRVNTEDGEEMLSEVSISASCPEAARLIYGSPEPMQFISEKIEESSDEEDDEDEAELGTFLKNVRDVSIAILQDRSLELTERIRRFLLHAEIVQEAINCWESEGESLPETIGVPDDIDSADTAPAENTKDKLRYLYFLVRMGVFSGLASIGERWAKRMELLYENFVGEDVDAIDEDDLPRNAFFEAYAKATDNLDKYLTKQNRLYEYEHLLVYYAFLFMNRSIDDYDYLSKAKLVVLSYLMNRDMDAGVFLQKGELDTTDREENARIYAREVEHAEENLADLEEEILFEMSFDTDSILETL